jgi:hypothetical protein
VLYFQATWVITNNIYLLGKNYKITKSESISAKPLPKYVMAIY